MLKIAALLYDDHAPERVVARFVETLRGRGVRVGGVVQNTHRTDGHITAMDLVELDTGTRLSIRQDLGSGSQSCVMDTQSLAASTAAVRRALAAGVDLMVLSKFSHTEAEGRGFIQEFQSTVLAGVPLLTCVKAAHFTHWRDFSGGLSLFIPVGDEETRLSALQAWWDQVSTTP